MTRCSTHTKQIFSQRLKELRQKKGVTQREMARDLRFEELRIHKLEAQKIAPTPFDLIDISRYFDVSVDYLLGVTWDMKRHETDNMQ